MTPESPTAAPTTTETSAFLLREGNVIVAPDGGQHTVTGRYAVDGISLHVDTDTGHHFSYTWYQAKTDIYDVLVSA